MRGNTNFNGVALLFIPLLCYCGFPRGNIQDGRPYEEARVKAPKGFSCNFLTVSRIKDVTNAKNDRKLYNIVMVEAHREEFPNSLNVANTNQYCKYVQEKHV